MEEQRNVVGLQRGKSGGKRRCSEWWAIAMAHTKLALALKMYKDFRHEFDIPKLKMDGALYPDLRYEVVVEESVGDCGDTKEYQRGDSEEESSQVGPLCRFGSGSMDGNESCILSRSDHGKRGIDSIGSVPLLSQ